MANRPGFVAGASAPVVPAPVVNDASVFGRRIAIDPSSSLRRQIPATTGLLLLQQLRALIITAPP
jgi:hypothetical protein